MTTPAPTGTDDVERDITYEVSYRATFHWQLGSMNDGLFIIDRRPCHNEDGCFDDCPNAPTLVLNVTALSETHARAIVGAHNDAVDALRAATTPKDGR